MLHLKQSPRATNCDTIQILINKKLKNNADIRGFSRIG